MANFVSILQETCQQYGSELPVYVEIEQDTPFGLQRCKCRLYDWLTEGTGTSKKIAKKNAAEFMLKIVKEESQFMEAQKNTIKKINSTTSVALKINVFAGKNKKQMPLFAEKGVVDGLFVVECTFDGYVTVGKGRSTKVAKEEALEDIAKHFDIHTAYNNYKFREERIEKVKNAIEKLMEICQRRKLKALFAEAEEFTLGKILHYVMSCSVHDLTTKSNPNYSKKNAKLEAAEMMLEKLNETSHFNTPERSPLISSEINFELEAGPLTDGKASVGTHNTDGWRRASLSGCSDEEETMATYGSELDPSEGEDNPYLDDETSDVDQPPEYNLDELLPEADLYTDNDEPLVKRSKN